MLRGETALPNITIQPSYAYWAGPEDFTYTGFDANKVSWNALTGEFTNVSTTTSIYKTQVTAKHKVTGKTATFDVVVNPKAVLLAVEPKDGRDRTSWLAGTADCIESMGIGEAVEYYDSFTKTEAKSILNVNDNCIFVSRSHGGYVTINGIKDTCIDTDEFDLNGTDEYLCASHLADLSNGELSNMKLAVYIGCKTAGPEANVTLPLTTVGKGATTAIGFSNTIYNAAANEWAEDFFGKLAQGKSVYEACDELNQVKRYRDNGLNEVVIYGNSELTFE